MKLKKICRWDGSQKLFRIARLVWDRGTVGDGKGYSSKLTLAVGKKLARFKFSRTEKELFLLGLRVTLLRSYGGRFV